MRQEGRKLAHFRPRLGPLHPRIVKTFTPPAPFRYPHDYSRTPTGTRLVGFLRSEGKDQTLRTLLHAATTEASLNIPETADCCEPPRPPPRVPLKPSGRTHLRFCLRSTGS